MKKTTTCILYSLIVLFGAILPVSAGFKGRGADGEKLGRLPRNTPDGTPIPEDPVREGTKTKMKEFICSNLVALAKKRLGLDAWRGFDQAERDRRLRMKLQEDYDSKNDAPKWDDLTPKQRMDKFNELRNDPAKQPLHNYLVCLIWNEIGCAAYDLASDAEKANLKLEAAVITEIGLDAYEFLLEDEQNRLKAAVDLDARAVAKVKIARCNVAKAIELIKCIPAPNEDTPSGGMVADCLQKTWDKDQICIDFVSEGAFGSIKPNCRGKERGICDPDNNPINISVRYIPCTKRDKVYDPLLYLLITTLYHEGLHALQKWDEKPPRFRGETPEQREARLKLLNERRLRAHCNEIEAHTAENTLINALCPQVMNVKNGAAAAHGDHTYLKKVLECFAGIPVEQDRKDAADAFKRALDFNEKSNDKSLEGYNERKKILQDGTLSEQEKRDRTRRVRKIALDMGGRAVTGGGASGLVEQFDFDPATGDEIPRHIATPLDEIYELHLALEGHFVLVMGADLASGEGVLLAYSDIDEDGFLDPESEQELIRNPLLFDPFDIIDDPQSGQFLMANLITGEIFALFEGPGFATYDLLPDALAPIGDFGFQMGEELVDRILLSEEGQTLLGLPGINGTYLPVLLPEYPIVSATFDEALGQFLPNQTVIGFDAYQYPPVIVQANGLPVTDTTSVINDTTTELLVRGVPNSPVQVLIVPNDVVLGPVNLSPEGRALMPLPVPLQPGMELVLQVVSPDIVVDSPSETIYYVRDSTPRLVNPTFDRETGFSIDLFGIPGMPHQILHSPDLRTPFEPLPIPPVIGTEHGVTLQLQSLLLDPRAPMGFFKAQGGTVQVAP